MSHVSGVTLGEICVSNSSARLKLGFNRDRIKALKKTGSFAHANSIDIVWNEA